MTEETALNALRLNDGLGWCPVCNVERESLPAPAEGTCAYCYNHLMKHCTECAHYRSGKYGNLQVGMSRCVGSPDKRWLDWRYARHSESKCGAEGKWAAWLRPNKPLRGVP